jgi:hypothetical protein
MKKSLNLSVIALVLFIASCKKNTTTTNNTNQYNPLSSQVGGTPNIPAGAAGALYAINTITFDQTSGTTIIDSEGLAMAWFGSYTNTNNAGAVTCNADSLFTLIPFANVNYPWYVNFISGNGAPVVFNTNAVQWRVSGNSSTGVPAFNYTDNTVWPVVTGFNVSSTVNIATSLTVNYAIQGATDDVFITITGSKGSKTSTASVSATSVTFSPSQLAQVAIAGIGDQLSVEIMPVKLSSSTISGKTYYFVKQNAFTQAVNVQ